MRLCFSRMYDLEYIPADTEDHWVDEFYLVDDDGSCISPHVFIQCYNKANEEEPWYHWKLPLIEFETNKFYLNNIFDYLLERMHKS